MNFVLFFLVLSTPFVAGYPDTSFKRVVSYTRNILETLLTSALSDSTSSGSTSTDGPSAKAQNVISLLQSHNLTEFVKLIDAAGLTSTLRNGVAPLTVFAASDDAINKWSQKDQILRNESALAQVVKYSILQEKINASMVTNNKKVVSLQGEKVRFNIFNKNGKTIQTVNGVPISRPDLQASNGVIHIIDRVLYPIPRGDIVTILSHIPQFSTLMELVKTADLVDAISMADPLTIFAPPNDAFERLSRESSLDELKNDKISAGNLLAYHLVQDPVFSSVLTDGQKIQTLQGNLLTVNAVNNAVTLNTVANVITEAPATNGVIQVIDHVLVPPINPFIV